MRRNIILVIDNGTPVVQNARFVRIGEMSGQSLSELDRLYWLKTCSYNFDSYESVREMMSLKDLTETLSSFYSDGLELVVIHPSVEKVVKDILCEQYVPSTSRPEHVFRSAGGASGGGTGC